MTNVYKAQFAPFNNTQQSINQKNNIDLLNDITVEVTVELGQTQMLLKDVLNCNIGTIIDLKKEAGTSLDLYANGKKFAKGEVVVIEDNYGIRITEIIGGKKNEKK